MLGSNRAVYVVRIPKPHRDSFGVLVCKYVAHIFTRDVLPIRKAKYLMHFFMSARARGEDAMHRVVFCNSGFGYSDKT